MQKMEFIFREKGGNPFEWTVLLYPTKSPTVSIGEIKTRVSYDLYEDC